MSTICGETTVNVDDVLNELQTRPYVSAVCTTALSAIVDAEVINKFRAEVRTTVNKGDTEPLTGTDFLSTFAYQEVSHDYFTVSDSGEISAYGSTLTAERAKVKAVMSWRAFTPIMHPQTNLVYYVGMSTDAMIDLNVIKGKVTFGAIPGLTIGASHEQITGTLLLSTRGMFGRYIVDKTQIGYELNASILNRVLMDFATIKARIFKTPENPASGAFEADPEIRINPQIIAVDGRVLEGAKLVRMAPPNIPRN